MKDKFDKIRSILVDAGKARQKAKAGIRDLESRRPDFAPEYFKAHVQPQIDRVQQEQANRTQKDFETVGALLAEIQAEAGKKHAALDLSHPAWQNALKVIELAGQQLDYQAMASINQTFSGNQPALRVLQGIYKNAGLTGANIDKMLYDVDATIEKAREFSYHSFIQGGSLNDLAGFLSKLAKFEGVDFPNMVDDAGMMEVTRRAAGLPEAAAEGTPGMKHLNRLEAIEEAIKARGKDTVWLDWQDNRIRVDFIGKTHKRGDEVTFPSVSQAAIFVDGLLKKYAHLTGVGFLSDITSLIDDKPFISPPDEVVKVAGVVMNLHKMSPCQSVFITAVITWMKMRGYISAQIGRPDAAVIA